MGGVGGSPKALTLQTTPGPTRSSRLEAGWAQRVRIGRKPQRLLLVAVANRKKSHRYQSCWLDLNAGQREGGELHILLVEP